MPGKVDADRRVELADVDPELERVGGDDRQQLTRGERRLDLAALLRRVAGPVGRDPRRRGRGSPSSCEPHAGEALDQLDPAAAAEEADRPRAVDHQVGEQLGRLGEDRAAGASAARSITGGFQIAIRRPARGAAVGVDSANGVPTSRSASSSGLAIVAEARMKRGSEP